MFNVLIYIFNEICTYLFLNPFVLLMLIMIFLYCSGLLIIKKIVK